MWLIIGLFVVGIVLGRLLTHKMKSVEWIDRLLLGIVVIFLFVLGLQAGANQEVIQKFDTLGWQALLISLCALLGSMVLVRLTIYPFLKEKKG